MKILFIEPPRWNGFAMLRADRCSRPAFFAPKNTAPFPYWLASSAQYARERKIKVDFFDANALDASWIQVEKKIMQSNPQIVVFSAANCSIEHDLKTAEITKKINQKIITAVYEPVLCPVKPEKIFEIQKSLDVIIAGEPEGIITDLAKKGFKAKGIIFMKGKKIIRNEKPGSLDISRLSMPAFDLLPIKLYSNIPVRYGRGCPFNCTFCILGSKAENSGLNKEVRFRKEEKILEELKFVEKFGKIIDFLDETFTINRKKTKSLCDKIIERKIKVKWTCQTRVDMVNKEILEKMKKAGCVGIGYGIESGDDKLLKKMKKGITASQIKKAFSLAKETGIPDFAYNIIGLIGESKESIRKTIELNKEIRPFMTQFAIATPMVGTEFWKKCVEKKYFCVSENEVDTVIVGTKPIISYPNISSQEMLKEIKKAMIEINFSYLKEMPQGFFQKTKFAAKRAYLAALLYFSPLNEFSGKRGMTK